MAYFTRLTDIITCSLSDILLRSDDPREALKQIIDEMKQGISSAERSLMTADRQVKRLENEYQETQIELDRWDTKARDAVQQKNEGEARICLIRRKGCRDLLAGLEQQKVTAHSSLTHLQTTFKALQARLADAERRLALPDHLLTSQQPVASLNNDDVLSNFSDHEEIEAELSSLKQELGL